MTRTLVPEPYAEPHDEAPELDMNPADADDLTLDTGLDLEEDLAETDELAPGTDPAEASASTLAAAGTEFEFVVGRRHFASLSLLVIGLVAAFTTVAYMVGRSEGNVVTVSLAAPAPPPPAAEPNLPGKLSADLMDAPLAGTPQKGALYLQLGYVDRGFATLMVHGARELGYPAFIVPSGSETLHRVLSGPFAGNDEYTRAKTTFDAMGLRPFPRRYTEVPAAVDFAKPLIVPNVKTIF